MARSFAVMGAGGGRVFVSRGGFSVVGREYF